MKKLRKKQSIVIIAICICIANLLCSVNIKQAMTQIVQPELRIEPNTYTATSVGETFNISVNIYNVQKDHRLVTAQFRVVFNSSILQVENVIEGPFMQSFNNTPTPPYTLFVYFVEEDPIYGPNVIVGIVIYPNATGVWTNFPEGNGTLAIITFKAVSQLWHPLSCDLEFSDTLLVNADAEPIDHTTIDGACTIKEIPLSISYIPAKPSIGEVVIFMSQQYTYYKKTVFYTWDFGDGYNVTTTSPTAHHIYAAIGNYKVTLTVAVEGEKTNTTVNVPIGFYPPLAIEIQADTTYFKRETVEFYILITCYGKGVDVTWMKALLYYNAGVVANLTDSIEVVGFGLYRITYTIQANANLGTYTLLVEAKYYELNGTAIKSFHVREVDLTPVIRAFGSALGTPGWNENCDVNGNSKIDGFDVAFVCKNFG